MPVLQVPAGEEGWPGGLPTLLKEEEKEEEEEEKKEDDDAVMEGKRRDEEDMQDRLMMEECHLLHHIQDKDQPQGAHEDGCSSAGTWTCRCQGQV